MKLIVANWKMNMTSKRIIDFFKKFNPSLNNSIVVICPSFPYICLVKNYLKKNMFLGAQNCHFENKGPFTGEVSAEMLKDLGVKYAIIGHSERRNNFNETNEVIKRKVLACLTSNIKPIICVGEIKPPRYLSEALSFIDKQLDPLRHGIVNLSKTIIAYEPVWAIGTGRAPDLAHLSRIIDYLRQKFGVKTILYGGSVDETNFMSFLPFVSGLLVGSTSLNPLKFKKICEHTA